MTHQDKSSEPIAPAEKNPPVSENQTEEPEWWEQFGDCYDYWPSLPDSEYDYLYWGIIKKKAAIRLKSCESMGEETPSLFY